MSLQASINLLLSIEREALFSDSETFPSAPRAGDSPYVHGRRKEAELRGGRDSMA